MNYTKEALAKHLEQKANLDELNPDDLAGLYLAHHNPPTLGELDSGELVKWAEQADANNYGYHQSVEEFAEYCYTEMPDEETANTVQEIAECVNWLRVWYDILRPDWYHYQINKDLFLFVAKWI